MIVPPSLPDIPLTCAQLHALGVPRHRLADLLDRGEVRRVLRGVYLRADVPDTHQVRARAAALVVSPFAVICDRTAAWLHGVSTFDYHELDILPPLETFVLRGHARTTREGCVGGERDLARRDLMAMDGVSVTTPLRTALDLACRLGTRDALAALDGFMRICGVSRESMRAELPRYFRRRGVVQLRRLVPLADERAESPGESWTRMAMLEAGLPIPDLQVWVHEDGVPVFRLDMAYPRSRVAVEYDGREFHASQQQRAHDLARRQWLRERGWTVIVVDKDSFTPEALQSWLNELRAALRLVA